MDRITCPSCRKKFEIAPGGAVKCPACKTAIAVTYRAPRPDGETGSRRSSKTRDRDSALGNSTIIVLSAIGVVVVMALAVGGYFTFRGSSPRSPQMDRIVAVAPERTPDAPPPKAVDAKAFKSEPAALPESTDPKSDPEFDPNPLAESPAPTQLSLDMPDNPAKGVKKVVRPVAGVTPESVQEAKRKGVAFLGATRNGWFNNDQHRVGYIALGGLTMVECKVHPTEPLLQQAADLTRKLAVATDQTYEIAVAILFLDRMGDQRDKALIQTLGARLIAGQESGGGFGYKCPILTPTETVQLLSFVKRTGPRPATAPSESNKGTESTAIGPDPLDPFAKAIAAPGKDILPSVNLPQGELVSQPPLIRPKNRLAANAGTIRLDSEPATLGALPQRLQKIPAVVNQGRERDQLLLIFPEAGGTDQSNLQFAVLGLWVARRHGVVSDRALLLAEARMRKMQAPDGRWEYNYLKTFPESMICAGMLSLAVGQAVHQPQPAALAHALANDTQITAATQSLGRFVANPKEDFNEGVPKISIFFLWSVERVAVLFNLAEIDGKDWYGWGAQSLIKHQAADGSWESLGYPGRSAHVDTCFALLFLARSNLVQEISSYIQMQTPLPQKRR